MHLVTYFGDEVDKVSTEFDTWCKKYNEDSGSTTVDHLKPIYDSITLLEWKLEAAKTSYEHSSVLYLAQVATDFQRTIGSYVKRDMKNPSSLRESELQLLPKIKDLNKDVTRIDANPAAAKRWKNVCQLFQWPDGPWTRKNTPVEIKCISNLSYLRNPPAHPTTTLKMASILSQDLMPYTSGLAYYNLLLEDFESLIKYLN